MNTPTALQQLLDRARQHLQAGRLEDAARVCSEALTIENANFEANQMLATIRNDQGRNHEALLIAEELLNHAPRHPSVLADSGNALLGLRRYEEAVARYNEALTSQPDFPQVFNNKGYALSCLGHYAAALECYDKAITLWPFFALAYNNRGHVLLALGRQQEALQSYRRAVVIKPDFVDAHNNLGNAFKTFNRLPEALSCFDSALEIQPNYVPALNNRGIVLHQMQRHTEALESYDRALMIQPDFILAICNRGNTLHALGRTLDALADFDRSLTMDPRHVGAWFNRGNALADLNRHHGAIASYDRALQLQPNFAEALNNRGSLKERAGDFEAALADYQQALAARPDFPEALNNRGNLLERHKRFDEALADLNRALSIKPDFPEALQNRAMVLRALKRPEAALADCDRALAIRPKFVDAWNNRGNALLALKRRPDALLSYDQALALDPDYAEGHYNKGVVLHSMKQFEEARQSFDRARELKPDHPYALGESASASLYASEFERSAEIIPVLQEHIFQRKSIIMPFIALSCFDKLPILLAAAQNYVADSFPTGLKPLWDGSKWQSNKIRIAYLSSDFQRHATSYLMAQLFELHDRSRFEVIGISFGVDDGSDLRSRLVRAFDQFHDVHGNSEYEIAKRVHDLRIDIAIDLKGYTLDSRPGVFAWRPAPIQVNYIGYPATMGAEFIDYIIADEWVAPFEHQPFYTEKIVHLPGCFQVNDAKRVIASHIPTRAELGLPDRGFVFCCFNNTYKIRRPLFDVWMRLLQAIDGSVLWLFHDNDYAVRNLRREAADRGIEPDRLIFARRMEQADHLARHKLADLFLDTLPVNAGATASDALWTGLPILTCLGKSFAGRIGASLLDAVGLPDLIARTLEEYETLALKLARDPDLLQQIKNRLDANRPTSAMFDTDQFRSNIEAAYLRMWTLWQSDMKPNAFSVSAPTDRPTASKSAGE
jgi:predicted O-linked N-acetylglucosamine transferase (SPINDLY family)